MLFHTLTIINFVLIALVIWQLVHPTPIKKTILYIRVRPSLSLRQVNLPPFKQKRPRPAGASLEAKAIKGQWLDPVASRYDPRP